MKRVQVDQMMWECLNKKLLNSLWELTSKEVSGSLLKVDRELQKYSFEIQHHLMANY